jgi:hypothetical protein
VAHQQPFQLRIVPLIYYLWSNTESMSHSSTPNSIRNVNIVKLALLNSYKKIPFCSPNFGQSLKTQEITSIAQRNRNRSSKDPCAWRMFKE